MYYIDGVDCSGNQETDGSDNEGGKRYCALRITGCCIIGIQKKTLELKEAQGSLSLACGNTRQAIFQSTAGDPDRLGRQLKGGSMCWWNQNDITYMQKM